MADAAADAAALAAARQAANRRLNDTISDLPKFYGTSKDTITAENLIDRSDSSINSLAWTQQMAFDFFRMTLHATAEDWIKMVRETNADYQTTWEYIKPLFKKDFGKKMDVAKVSNVLDNLKMDPSEPVMKYATRMNNSFSQLRDLVPLGRINNLPANPADRTDAVCQAIHVNAVRHTHLQIFKYFFIAGLPKFIMTTVADKDPETFTDAYVAAVKCQDLAKGGNTTEHAAHAVAATDDTVNQIRTNGAGNGTQNPYRGNFRGRGGRGNRGAPRGGQQGRGGYNNGGFNKPGDNQAHNNQPKLNCWYCNIPGHRQEDCRKRQRDNKPCVGLNGSTYWPKPKQALIGEEGAEQETQGAIGEMYTGQLANVFSGFQ